MKDTRRQNIGEELRLAIHKHGFQGLRTDQVIKEPHQGRFLSLLFRQAGIGLLCGG